MERYTFEDRDGTEDSNTTTVAAEAYDFARRYRQRMIAHVFEWADSELVADYTDPHPRFRPAGRHRPMTYTERQFFDRLAQPAPVEPGSRVELTGPMTDDPNPRPVGSRGTVTGGNGAQLSVEWDDGSRLMLLPGLDPYRVLNTSEREHEPVRASER